MHVVILGGGGAGISAIKTIREKDKKTEITLISKEGCPYYSPVILPYYIEGEISRESLFLEGWDFYRENKIEFLKEKEVKYVNPTAKTVELNDGYKVEFDALLIATGASPSLPPIDGIKNKGVFVLRTLSDAESIIKHLKEKVAIIGTGPVAVELGMAIRRKGLNVTLIGRSRIMRRLFHPDFSEIIHDIMVKNGMEILLGQRILEIQGSPAYRVLTHQFEVDCDMVVIATGVKPNTDFLKETEIKVGESGGIIVNKRMQSSAPDVFAAGDCVEVIDFVTGERRLNAIWPEAISQGKIAALNMLEEYAEYPGAIQRNVLNIFDIPAISIGCHEGEEVSFVTPEAWKRYTKREGKIVGIQIIGEVRKHGLITPILKRLAHPEWLLLQLSGSDGYARR